MIATIVSLIVAFFFYANAATHEVALPITPLGIVILIVGIVMLFLPAVLFSYAWAPLQRAENYLTLHVVEMYSKDRHLSLSKIILMIFPWLSFLVVLDLLVINSVNPNILFAVWIVALGVSIDALYNYIKRTFKYLDPIRVVDLFTKEALKSVQDEKQLEFCEWIDALSEVAIRGTQKNMSALTIKICNNIEKAARLYLQTAKSFTHHETNEMKKIGVSDEVSFTLLYIMQRLEMINAQAIRHHLEPVCSALITVTGKIILSAAKLDLSLVPYPAPFLGRFSVAAQRQGFTEVGPKAIITLLEVSKSIVNEMDLTYLELQDPFQSIINQMYIISREIFKHDKNIPIAILQRPFLDLKELFSSEKMANHVDTPVILQRVDNVLAEFSALESVMRTLPPVMDKE